MKKRKLTQALAVGILAAFLLSGCSLVQKLFPRNSDSAVPAASFSESSAVSSDDSSSAPSSEISSDPSSTAPSSAASVDENTPTSSQPGQVLNIETDNAAFNTKFKANPIDKAYIADSNNALSSVDMVNVSNKYAQVWQDEISHAWSELQKKMAGDSSGKPAALKTEEQNWEAGKAAAIRKISDDARQAGGSMAQVNEASQIMDFYRSRAAALYRELYDYEPNFTYNYKAG